MHAKYAVNSRCDHTTSYVYDWYVQIIDEVPVLRVLYANRCVGCLSVLRLQLLLLTKSSVLSHCPWVLIHAVVISHTPFPQGSSLRVVAHRLAHNFY